MMVRAGVDLVYLPKFDKTLKNGAEEFIRRVFTNEELNIKHRSEIVHLASIFAAKEAVMKALSLSADSWHDIIIKHDALGAPLVEVSNQGIKNYSLSISHDGDYVIAQFVAIIKE